MKNILTIISSAIILSVFPSCELINKKVADGDDGSPKPLARYKDTYLYPKDIAPVPRHLIGADSLEFVTTQVTKWLKQQLLLDEAKDQVAQDDSEIIKKIEQYKNILLIEALKKQYVQEKLDTTVTRQNLHDFFSNNPKMFLAKDHIIYGSFIKVPSDLQSPDHLKNWLKCKSENDIQELRSYCLRFGKNFVVNNWFSFREILKQTPFDVPEEKKSFLRKDQMIERSDAEFTYYLYIKDHVEPGAPAPVDYFETQIKNLILNERKVNLIKDFEYQLYKEAGEKNKIEIF